EFYIRIFNFYMRAIKKIYNFITDSQNFHWFISLNFLQLTSIQSAEQRFSLCQMISSRNSSTI
ncbi:MAG TPA: hypothetical protein VLH08_20555, partial [Acidobacteriota bacterium]|nr:hypothetical protein [Acidobacteriota bacterium]